MYKSLPVVLASPTTREDVARLADEGMERYAADEVAKVVAELAGKPVNVRHEARFPDLNGTIQWSIFEEYGMVKLAPLSIPVAVQRSLARQRPADWPLDFLVNYTPPRGYWPTVEEWKERNSWAYEGRERRNEQRRVLIEDPAAAQIVVDATNRLAEAFAEFQAAREDFDAVCDVDSPGEVVEYQLREIALSGHKVEITKPPK